MDRPTISKGPVNTNNDANANHGVYPQPQTYMNYCADAYLHYGAPPGTYMGLIPPSTLPMGFGMPHPGSWVRGPAPEEPYMSATPLPPLATIDIELVRDYDFSDSNVHNERRVVPMEVSSEGVLPEGWTTCKIYKPKVSTCASPVRRSKL